MKIHALHTKDAGFWFGNEVVDVKPGESCCLYHSYSASPRDKEKGTMQAAISPGRRQIAQGGRLDLGDARVSTPT